MANLLVDTHSHKRLRKVSIVSGKHPAVEKKTPSDKITPPFLKRFLFVLPYVVSLLGAIGSGTFLFQNTVISSLVTIIINIGLDPQRSQLISALVMTAGAAFIGAACGRSRLGALVGASLVFLFGYLIGFVTTELKPLHDPGGLLEPLNMDALVRNAATLQALSVLGAFIGAAVGNNIGEVVLSPFYQIVRYLWHFFSTRLPVKPGDISQRFTIRLPRMSKATASLSPQVVTPLQLAIRGLGAVMVLVLLAIASNAGELFIFSPEVGIHTQPIVNNLAGIPSHGKLLQDGLVSQLLGKQRKPFEVYLPPTYNTLQGQNKRYPTLYLLHGSPGTDIDWVKGGKIDESADTLIAAQKIPELIIIMPDGNGRKGSTSEWGNSFDGRQPIETYLTSELVHYVDQHYRTIPNASHRAIGGLSMGGFGAMNIAIHHPDVFGTTISLGGYYRAEGAVWGNSPLYREDNSPIDTFPLTKKAWKLQIILGAATKDQPYYTDTVEFMRELESLHVPYKFDLERGYHSWRVWQIQMYKSLLLLQWK